MFADNSSNNPHIGRIVRNKNTDTGPVGVIIAMKTERLAKIKWYEIVKPGYAPTNPYLDINDLMDAIGDTVDIHDQVKIRSGMLVKQDGEYNVLLVRVEKNVELPKAT